MRIVTVIQARMASTRLPRKVLLPLAGEPLLARMVERVRRANEVDAIVVATTTAPDDDGIVALCDRIGVSCFRGHPTDCLQRHVDAVAGFAPDAVVKIPSDCPMIDPRVIDQVLGVFRTEAARVDYVGNLHPGSWPDGNDVEVMHHRVLLEAAAEATDDFDREHTTPFVWSRPERYSLRNVTWDSGRDYSRSHRWVVDWQVDYELVSACFDALYPTHGSDFRVEDVLAFLDGRPELAAKNAAHRDYDYRLTRDQPVPLREAAVRPKASGAATTSGG